MNSKKTIIASIIGVAMLVVLVVGATFAYFTTAVTSDNGETLVTGKTDAIGSISLTNPTSNLHITLNALDMAQDNLNTYYATNDASKNYDTEEVLRDIAVATLTGGEATTYYECTTTINVSVSGTMVAGLQTGDAYIQFGGLLTDKVDLKNVSSTGYPVTFKLNGTDKLTDKVSASIAIENRNANQNSIAGKELSVRFTNNDLVCNVVEAPQPEAFAIYSETDKSLRFYKNYDQVQVGDTYNNLVVTAKYTGFEEKTYGVSDVPWRQHIGEAEIVVFENKISPISTAYWFSLERDYWVNATIDLTKLDTSNTINMEGMFKHYCADLIGLGILDTSKVTNMSSIFVEAHTNIDGIQYWDVSSVTNMEQMFSTTSVPDISGWDTSNVTNMSFMFYYINVVPDISQWDVSNVTNMSYMFSGANNIPDISGWDTPNVTDMSSMFEYSWNTGYTLENPLDLSGWNVSKVSNSTNFISNISPSGSIIAPNFGA